MNMQRSCKLPQCLQEPYSNTKIEHLAQLRKKIGKGEKKKKHIADLEVQYKVAELSRIYTEVAIEKADIVLLKGEEC